MKANVGLIDKIVRVAVAVAAVILYFTDVVTGVLGIVLLAVAGIFVVTSFLSFCPLYAIFGLSTCPLKTAKSDQPATPEA